MWAPSGGLNYPRAWAPHRLGPVRIKGRLLMGVVDGAQLATALASVTATPSAPGPGHAESRFRGSWSDPRQRLHMDPPAPQTPSGIDPRRALRAQ